MAVQNLIKEIESDVADVVKTGFEYINTYVVPNRGDNQLTFEKNTIKRGKILKSCVLYVDIRDSVSLTEKHQTQTMGRVYSAFSKAIIKIAKYYNGHIRNIIGDRVMVVFPSNNCFNNSVNCAITINHIAQYVIKKAFPYVDFKCGIGIDYGDLRVIKVGIQRNGNEGADNKSLVWVGYPANFASRLTDVANKSINETYFEVTRNPLNPKAISHRFIRLSAYNSPPILYNHKSINPFLNNHFNTIRQNEPLYLTTEETVEMSIEEFANNMSSLKDGELYMTGGKFIRFSKKSRQINYSPILITNNVYNGLKQANHQNNTLSKFWIEQKHQIKNLSNSVYGADLTWQIN